MCGAVERKKMLLRGTLLRERGESKREREGRGGKTEGEGVESRGGVGDREREEKRRWRVVYAQYMAVILHVSCTFNFLLCFYRPNSLRGSGDTKPSQLPHNNVSNIPL